MSCSAIEEYPPNKILVRNKTVRIDLQAFGQEKATDYELLVYWRAFIPGEPAVTLRPGLIAREVLKGTGILTCDKEQCISRLNLPCLLIEKGWVVPTTIAAEIESGSKSGSTKCLLWPQLEDVARCVVVRAAQYNTSRGRVVLRRGECVSCCTSSLIRAFPKLNHEKCFHIV